MQIGVLAIQGDFAAHGRILERLGVDWCEVRTAEQLDQIDGLILPGGETTTMLKFLFDEEIMDPLRHFARQGRPLFGTCAGAILMAREVENPTQPSLGVIDISIRRNAYGRQVDSFVDLATSADIGPPPLEVVFIRAPIITEVGSNATVLVEHQGHPVLVRQRPHLVATFHPELTSDTRVHQLFIDSVKEAASARVSNQ